MASRRRQEQEQERLALKSAVDRTLGEIIEMTGQHVQREEPVEGHNLKLMHQLLKGIRAIIREYL